MDPKAHALTVTRTARYYTLGEAGEDVQQCWIATHGYGQLAGQFIHKFRDLIDPATYVIAPEGLSRFYWQGFDGPVVASWMTREDRLSEINDFSQYLNQLYLQLKSRLPASTDFIFFGFSQGGATLMRWAERERPAFKHLVLWGSAIPEDLQYDTDYWADKKLWLIHGNQDPYITPERIAQQTHLLQRAQFQYQMLTYDGGHAIDRKVLQDFQKLIGQ